MKAKLLTIGLVIVLVLGTTTSSIAEEAYKIGAILPLTGDIAEYGNRCKKGIDLAIEEINNQGEISGKKIEVIYEDSKGFSKGGVSSAQKLISINRVSVIIGAVASSVTLGIVPIATENKVVLFSPASSSPKLSGVSPFFFRDWPTDVLEARLLAEFTFNKLGIRKVAILYVNNDYGLGLMNEFKKKFVELKGQVVAIETYPQGAKEFRSILTKITKDRPSAIYLAGYHKEMALATKQIRELRIKAQILGDADYGIQELLTIAGIAAEGAIYATPTFEPTVGTETMRHFVEKFKIRYGENPTVFEANGYDAARIIAEAISHEGYSGEKIAGYIRGLKNYDGVSGTMTFEETGDVVKPISIKIVRGGKFLDYTD